jgi:hypothetical protein
MDTLRWFVTLTFSMSASYDFGDTPCPFLPSSNNFTASEGLQKNSRKADKAGWLAMKISHSIDQI